MRFLEFVAVKLYYVEQPMPILVQLTVSLPLSFYVLVIWFLLLSI